MDGIQILVEYIAEECNFFKFYGYDLMPQLLSVSCYLCILFQIWFQILAISAPTTCTL